MSMNEESEREIEVAQKESWSTPRLVCVGDGVSTLDLDEEGALNQYTLDRNDLVRPSIQNPFPVYKSTVSGEFMIDTRHVKTAIGNLP